MVRKAQAAAWEEKFMAMKAKQKESNKVSLKQDVFPLTEGNEYHSWPSSELRCARGDRQRLPSKEPLAVY